MKTRTTTWIMAIVFVLIAGNIFAQGAYVSANIGYGFMASSANLNNGDYLDFYNYTSGSNSATYEQVNVSLGKGLNFGGTIGYMFNKNIGAELGISYLMGGKSKAKDSYSGGTTDYTLSSKMLRINPCLVLTAGLEKINPYARFGLVIGKGSVKYEYNDNDDGDISIYKMKLDGGMALGLTAAIGATYSLNDKMSLFGELNMVNLSYAPKQGEITEATYNGIDELPNMTTSDKKIDFVDSYTEQFETNPPDSEPTQMLKYKLPYGSFGINFGVRFAL
jgi:hypothetical protein